MSVLNKKLKRDLFAGKGMLSAIIAIITVGIACLVAMLGTYYNLHYAKIDYYSQCRMADFWVHIKKAPTTEIEKLSKFKGISSLRSRIDLPVIVDLENVQIPISGKVLSMPETRKTVINNILIRRGTYFTSKRRNEVIVSEKFADARNITPGNFIHLVMNGQRKKLFVIGTAISSEFMYLTPQGSINPDPKSYGAFWIKRSYAEDVFGFHGASNSLVGKFSSGEFVNHSEILQKIEHKLKSYGVFSTVKLKNQNSNLTLNSEMSGLKTQAVVLPLIFLGVAVLVINVVMLRMAEQQRTIIGTLKALGIKNKTIFIHFLKYGLTIGAIGGISGCIFGYWLASEMTEMYKAFFTFPHLINKIYPGTIGASLFISVFFSALGTLRGVKKVTMLNPAEAMHPPPPQSCGKIIIEKWTGLWNSLDFRWQIVLRGIFRNKGKTAVGIIASALGASLLILALGLSDSLNYMMDFQFRKILLSDYNINLRNPVNIDSQKEIQNIPGITYVEEKFELACHFINRNYRKKGTITGLIKNAELTKPCLINGKSVKVPESGLLMTSRLAEQLHLKPGDTVKIIPVKGRRKAHHVKVMRLIDSTFGLPVYANYKWLNLLVGEETAVTGLQMKGRMNRGELNYMFRELKKFPQLASFDIISRQKNQMKHEFIDKLQSMTYTMIIFAGVIFFASILNASLIELSDRKREIATFRVLGYTGREIGDIFLRKALLINISGAFLGLPLGYFMLYEMTLQFKNDMYSTPCIVNFGSWVLTIILSFVFVISAFLVIQKVINKMEWSEALKMKE